MHLKKAVFIVLDIALFSNFFTFSQENSNSIGTYAITVQRTNADVYENTTADVFFETEYDTYTNNYGKWIKIVSEKNEISKHKFSQYFADWQYSGQNEDFFQYSTNRAEQEKKIELCYDKAIKKFGVGTALIATTWIVSFVVPSGTLVHATVLIIANNVTEAALAGSVVGGITSCGIALLQGKNTDEVFFESVNGLSEGYIIGALTGLVSGTGKIYKLTKESKAAKSFSGQKTIFDGKVFNENGEEIGVFRGKLPAIGDGHSWQLIEDGNGNFIKILETHGDFYEEDFLRKQLIAKSNDYIKTLSLKEQDIIGQYTTRHYLTVNSKLRNGIIDDEIKTLKNIVRNNKSPNTITVFRGDNGFIGNRPITIRNGKFNLPHPEEVITNSSFTSTSLQPKYAISFSKNEIPIFEEIIIPEGSNALYISDSAKGLYGVYQQEVLLDSESKFKILETAVLQPGTILKDGTVIEQTTAFVKMILL